MRDYFPIDIGRVVLVAVVLAGSGCTTDEKAGVFEMQTASYGDPIRPNTRPTITTPAPLLVSQRRLGGDEDFARINFIQPIDEQRLLVGDEMAVPHLSVVDLSTGAVAARSGGHGEGPSEFISPGKATRDPVDANTWWIFDYGNVRWTAIAIDKTIAIANQISLANLPMWPETPIWLDDDNLLVHGLFYGFAFVKAKLNEEQRRIESFQRFSGPQPFDETTIGHGTGLRSVNRSFMALHPSKDLFALAYQFGNQIDIFSTDGAIVASVRGPYDVEAKFRVVSDRFHWDDDNQSGYVEAYGTRRFFYLRWDGRRINEPTKTTSEMHRFDWNGQFLKAFKLDHAVLAFAVSAADDRLWGYVEDPRSTVLEWHVPPFETTTTSVHAASGSGRVGASDR